MSEIRERFETRLDREVLTAIRKIAEEEGREVEGVVEEALRAHIAQREKTKPRSHVIEAYRSSLQGYGSLYEKLAK